MIFLLWFHDARLHVPRFVIDPIVCVAVKRSRTHLWWTHFHRRWFAHRPLEKQVHLELIIRWAIREEDTHYRFTVTSDNQQVISYHTDINAPVGFNPVTLATWPLRPELSSFVTFMGQISNTGHWVTLTVSDWIGFSPTQLMLLKALPQNLVLKQISLKSSLHSLQNIIDIYFLYYFMQVVDHRGIIFKTF